MIYCVIWSRFLNVFVLSRWFIRSGFADFYQRLGGGRAYKYSLSRWKCLNCCCARRHRSSGEKNMCWERTAHGAAKCRSRRIYSVMGSFLYRELFVSIVRRLMEEALVFFSVKKFCNWEKNSLVWFNPKDLLIKILTIYSTVLR